jgi:hypothetical protein
VAQTDGAGNKTQTAGAGGSAAAAQPEISVCPRCGYPGEELGHTSSGRYEFSKGGPGVLLHLLFFFVSLAGVTFFLYVGGYQLYTTIAGAATVALAVVSLIIVQRAYRPTVRSWYRCPRCNAQWDVVRPVGVSRPAPPAT